MTTEELIETMPDEFAYATATLAAGRYLIKKNTTSDIALGKVYEKEAWYRLGQLYKKQLYSKLKPDTEYEKEMKEYYAFKELEEIEQVTQSIKNHKSERDISPLDHTKNSPEDDQSRNRGILTALEPDIIAKSKMTEIKLSKTPKDRRKKSFDVMVEVKIPGVEPNDLANELRVHLFKQLKAGNYHKEKASFKTWANTVMNNFIKNLMRDSLRDKRRVHHEVEEFCDENIHKVKKKVTDNNEE